MEISDSVCFLYVLFLSPFLFLSLSIGADAPCHTDVIQIRLASADQAQHRVVYDQKFESKVGMIIVCINIRLH